MNELVTWMVYAIAAFVMLSAAASAVVFGLALRLAAEFLRELVDEREEHADDASEAPAEARGKVGPSR